MAMVNLQENGEYIKSIRKKRGLKLTDLADGNISSSTISNIEKGLEGVTEDKRVYLCEKLNLIYHDIPQLIQNQREKRDSTLITLRYIDKLIDLGEPRIGLKRLRKLDLQSDYLKAIGYYLKGRAFVIRDDIPNKEEKTKPYFEKSIHHIGQSNELDKLNIQASCYNQLAQVSYYVNDFENAIKYTDLGIESYQKNAEKKHLIFSLLMNKVVYLDKLGYRDRATEILDDLWNQETEITHMDVIANMHDIQANILIKSGMYSKAIKTAEEGLAIAQVNKRYNRVVELLLTIGIAYSEMDQLTTAEEAFTIALDLEGYVKQKYLFLPIYTNLGKIYMQQGKPNEATKILESAINVKTTNHHADRYIEALTTLADSQYHQGFYDKSLEIYENALKLARRHSLLTREDDILFKMCQYWDGKDKQKHYEILVNKFETDVKLKNRKAGDNYVG